MSPNSNCNGATFAPFQPLSLSLSLSLSAAQHISGQAVVSPLLATLLALRVDPATLSPIPAPARFDGSAPARPATQAAFAPAPAPSQPSLALAPAPPPAARSAEKDGISDGIVLLEEGEDEFVDEVEEAGEDAGEGMCRGAPPAETAAQEKPARPATQAAFAPAPAPSPSS